MRILLSAILALVLSSSLIGETVTLDGIGKSTPIRIISDDGADYICASDLFGALGIGVDWKTVGKELQATARGKKLLFEVDKALCLVDESAYNLINAPILREKELYLPLNQTLYLMSDIFERVLYHDETKKTIVAIKEGFNVSGVNLQEKVNGDLLEIMLTKRLNYEVFISEGNWVNITIHDGRVDVPNFTRRKPDPRIINVRAFQFSNSAQVSVQMRKEIIKFHDNYASDPHRIQISLENAEFAVEQGDTSSLINHEAYNPIDVIVIDPGHGGDRDGAKGRNGLKEKDVVLDIALRLEALMARGKRFTTVLTRRDDSSVGLEDRANTANLAKGDLFVSIHANSAEQKTASGSMTYFLAAAKSDEARIAEMLENQDFAVDNPDATDRNKKDLDFIIKDVVQTEYLNQSRQLAELIQSEMQTGLNIKSRGIDQAGFVVLNKVQMPSVLVETAFISNKVEERLLGQDEFRQSIAESIYRGITKFADRYDKEKPTNAGSQ